jgi:hypothetical protein
MRLFQNSVLYPSYRPRLDMLAAGALSFEARRRVFLEDRFVALHFLQPVLQGDPEAFFTNADDDVLQRQWAQEKGMSAKTSLENILLAQIEHHRTEVFYNLDPVRYPSSFVAKLPGCVRTALCWRAVPENVDLTAYAAVLGNFPSISEFWRSRGCRSELFYPAIDPEMEKYGHGDRPIDVSFIGGYSRRHSVRAKALERVACLADTYQVVYCIDASRLTRLSESLLGRLLPLRKHRRPEAIAKIAMPPVFGRQLYDLFGRSKVVLNGAIDASGSDRGNMRCFEAMGCGALLMSDAGNYPEGMKDQETIATYGSAEDVASGISQCLKNWPHSAKLAASGRRRVSEVYSKSSQWNRFVALVAQV